MINVVYIVIYTHDGILNEPITIQDYISNGGNTFDYYVGYLFVTACDTKGCDITIIKPLLMIGYTLLWYFGAKILMDTEIKSIRNLSRLQIISVVITTFMSLYGMYYVYTYISKGFDALMM